jgi:hypothetical protein
VLEVKEWVAQQIGVVQIIGLEETGIVKWADTLKN